MVEHELVEIFDAELIGELEDYWCCWSESKCTCISKITLLTPRKDESNVTSSIREYQSIRVKYKGKSYINRFMAAVYGQFDDLCTWGSVWYVEKKIKNKKKAKNG